MQLAPGFQHPVADANSTFRSLLDAFAHPGQIQVLSATPAWQAYPSGLLSLLLSLCDQDTQVYCSPSFAKPDLASWLHFHTQAPITQDPSQANFALVQLPQEAHLLANFSQGHLENPHLSTSVLAVVDDFNTHCACLSGPGIQEVLPVNSSAFSEEFMRFWQVNHRAYPLGVDLVLIQEQSIMGLPRTSQCQPCGHPK